MCGDHCLQNQYKLHGDAYGALPAVEADRTAACEIRVVPVKQADPHLVGIPGLPGLVLELRQLTGDVSNHADQKRHRIAVHRRVVHRAFALSGAIVVCVARRIVKARGLRLCHVSQISKVQVRHPDGVQAKLRLGGCGVKTEARRAGCVVREVGLVQPHVAHDVGMGWPVGRCSRAVGSAGR